MRFLPWLAGVLVGLLSWPVGAEEDVVTGVASVRDPVTVAISGARYRLEAIEPPSEAAVCGERSCADAATEELAQFVSGHEVACTKVRRLGHGFFLASCRIEDDEDAAEHLLRQGLAQPGADASPTLQAAAEEARLAGRGLWAASK
jgi:endonuclease YncB( thermonuclease family)